MLTNALPRGISLADGESDNGVELLCYFRHRWLDFRAPEVESVASPGVELRWRLPFGGHPLSPFWYLRLPDLQEASRIAGRSVLLKAFVQVWGEGDDFSELSASIVRCPDRLKEPHCSENASFKVIVDGWGCKLSQEEKVRCIERLSFLPLKGPISLSAPDETYWLIVADPSRATGFPAVPRRLYFGRQIAVPDLSAVQRYALSRRAYLGPTSMDAEMALVMCNHAQVGRGSLVMDPFVGTGSILVAAAHFGAIAVGCDVDAKILTQEKTNERGERRTVWSNFSDYGLPPPAGLLVCDVHRSPFAQRPLEVFDAVICDPPYGVRAGSRRQPREEDGRRSRTRRCTVGETCRHLLDAAARLLAVGGRLVYFCPSLPGGMAASEAPSHPAMECVFCCEQYLTMKYTRCLVTMRKTKSYVADEAAAFYAENGPPTMAVDDIRERVFDSRGPKEKTRPIPGFRCKQL